MRKTFLAERTYEDQCQALNIKCAAVVISKQINNLRHRLWLKIKIRSKKIFFSKSACVNQTSTNIKFKILTFGSKKPVWMLNLPRN